MTPNCWPPTYPWSATSYPDVDSVESALKALRCGYTIIVLDNESAGAQGYMMCAAQFVTPKVIDFMTHWAKYPLGLAMETKRLDELSLNSKVREHTNHQNKELAIGMASRSQRDCLKDASMAVEQARTVQSCINPKTTPADLHGPGEIFPLRAKSGGVLVNAGPSEAVVDLTRLAGLYPSGLLCEIQTAGRSRSQSDPLLPGFVERYSLKVITIADLISHRLRCETSVRLEAVTDLPTEFGTFQGYVYRNLLDDTEHIALVKGNPLSFRHKPVMVRVHSECLTGDTLGSLRCDCGAQLQNAMKMIARAGNGVVIYLRQEGRGIGLVNKLKAYALQDLGLDTVEANEKLGFKADLRHYGVGAQMLKDIGVRNLCLITNNPRKISGLSGFGLNVVDRIPLITEMTTHNVRYLSVKAQKLGHWLSEEEVTG